MPPKRKTPRSGTRAPTRSSARLQASPVTPAKEELPQIIPISNHDDDQNKHKTPPPPEAPAENSDVRAAEELEQPKESGDAPPALTPKDGTLSPSPVSAVEEEISQTIPPFGHDGDQNQHQTPPPPLSLTEKADVDVAEEAEQPNESADAPPSLTPKHGSDEAVPMDEEKPQDDSVKVVEEVVVEKTVAVDEKREILVMGDAGDDGGSRENQQEILVEEGEGIGEQAQIAEDELGEEETQENAQEEEEVQAEGQKDREGFDGEASMEEEDIQAQGENKEGDFQEVSVEEEEREGEEVREADAVALPMEERKKLKDYEVFIGGLDKNIVEDDLKNVFSEVGEVVQVRLVKKSLSPKTKGFAFVRFATIDQAKAAVELKSVKINGRDCGVTRNTDNETLYLRNISKTWTSADLMEQLQSYKIENLVDAHLIDDPDNKGKNRGYAFLEFSTHMDAVTACAKLQKRGVYFGTDSPAEVAFAKSAVQPDEEIMAQVKSVFLDGLSSSWDEEYVKVQLEKYGEIEKVELARDMVTAKRKDFAFVNFTTREAALTCIDGVNKDGIGCDGENMMVKASLRKPLQKKPPAKGGWRGFSRNYETPKKSYTPFRATGYGGSGRANYSKGDKGYRKDLPPSSGRSSTWHARDFERRAPSYSFGGRSGARYVEEQPYVSGHREEYPASYSGYSSQRRYSGDAYGPQYEHYPASVPMGQEYLPVSGSKRPYSGTEDDILYARHIRNRTDLGIEAVQPQGSSANDSYSRAVPQVRQGYGNASQTFGSQYLSGSSTSRSYY